MKVVRSIARTGPGCHEGCGVLLYVKNGKLVKVEGDPEFPSNQGRLCPRCLALTQVVYHPDRLKYPLKRAGVRGEGKWQRITWEEAYDTIASKFNEIKRNLSFLFFLLPPDSSFLSSEFLVLRSRSCSAWLSKSVVSILTRFSCPLCACYSIKSPRTIQAEIYI